MSFNYEAPRQIKTDKYDLMSSEELSNLLSEKEKEYQTTNNSFGMIAEKVLEIEKKIIDKQKDLDELRGKKKDCQIEKNKASTAIKQINSELNFLRNKMFNIRRQGR